MGGVGGLTLVASLVAALSHRISASSPHLSSHSRYSRLLVSVLACPVRRPLAPPFCFLAPVSSLGNSSACNFNKVKTSTNSRYARPSDALPVGASGYLPGCAPAEPLPRRVVSITKLRTEPQILSPSANCHRRGAVCVCRLGEHQDAARTNIMRSDATERGEPKVCHFGTAPSCRSAPRHSSLCAELTLTFGVNGSRPTLLCSCACRPSQ